MNTMVSKMSLRYLKVFSIDSIKKTKLKYYQMAKERFMNYLMFSSWYSFLMSTMVYNMSLGYLKAFSINFYEKKLGIIDV